MKQIFYLLIAIIFLVSCGEHKWEQAQTEHTIEAYENFIAENPKSKYIKKADSLIFVLKIEQILDLNEWQEAKEKNSLAEYIKYFASHPKGAYIDSANIQIKILEKTAKEENEIWQKTTEENTFIAYNNYIESNPNTTFTEKAKEFRNKKFVELLDSDFSRIKEFFEVAELVFSDKKILPEDTILNYFSEEDCKIVDMTVTIPTDDDSFSDGRYNYYGFIADLMYYTKEFKKGNIFVTYYNPGIISFIVYYRDDLISANGELSITFELREGIYQVTKLVSGIDFSGC